MDSLTELQNLDGKRMVKRIMRAAATGEVVTGDYERGAMNFRPVCHPVASIRDFARVLDQVALSPGSCVIRGEPKHPELTAIRRQKINFEDVRRHWSLHDLDGIPLPPGLDWRAEPEAAVRYAVGLMPEPFHGATCWWAFSAGQGIKPGLRLRLGFWHDVPLSADELKIYLAEKIQAPGVPKRSWRRVSPVDPAVYNVVQVNYIGRPIFEDAMVDPVPRRSGLLVGTREVVSVPLPILPRWSGTAGHAPRAKAPGSGASDVTAEVVTDPYRGESSGFDHHVESIGDGPGGQGFYAPMTAAVASWIGQHGPDADVAPMIEAIAAAARSAVRIAQVHTAEYVEEKIKGLPALVEWVRAEERRKASVLSAVGQRCDPGRSLPTMSVADASVALRSAVDEAFARILPAAGERRARALSMTSDEIRDMQAAEHFFDGHAMPQIAIGAGVGLGKTEAALSEVHSAVRDDRSLRVAISVPTHVTADDIAGRLNRKAGRIIAKVWRGTGQPDPARPHRLMCPMNSLVEQVRAAGGKAAQVCGAPRRKIWCDYHPRKPEQMPSHACAYRQQFDADVQVWIFPHAMLTSAAPSVFMTTERRHLGYPFDLLVLDEAPWLSFLGGCGPRPVQVKVEDLVRLARWPGGGAWRTEYLEIGRRLAVALDGHAGFLKREALVEARLSASLADRAAALAWNLRGTLPIRRDLPPEAAAIALDEHGGAGGVAALVRRFWSEVATFLRSGATVAPHTLQAISDDEGHPAIRLRWKDEMHRHWIGGPILYLDATLVPKVARCWLPDLDVTATIQAAETNVHRTALTDRALGKSSLVTASTDAEEKRQAAKVGHILRLIEVQAFLHRGRGRRVRGDTPGPDVAVVGYDALDRHIRGLVPNNVAVGHFNALRGFDGWRGVGAIVVIGRPEASPLAVEQYGSVASGELIPPCGGRWYPVAEGSHLMRDGAGRRVSTYAHPHPLAEAFRRQVQTELVQVEGRARSVRRGARDPLVSIMLTSTPTDLAVDAAVTEGDVLDQVPMVAVLLARGLVPNDARDAAAVLPDLFADSTDGAAAFRQRAGRETQGVALSTLFTRADDDRPGTGGELVTFPYYNLLGKRHDFEPGAVRGRRATALPDAFLDFRCFRYKAHGRRNAGLVLIDTARHPDPEEALQDVVGQLASFVPVEPPAWLAAIQASYRDVSRQPAGTSASVALDLPQAPSPFEILLATKVHAANAMLPLADEIYTVGAHRLSVHLFHRGDHGADLRLYRKPGATWPPQRTSATPILVEKAKMREPTTTAFEIALELGARPRSLMVGPVYKRLERDFGQEKALALKLKMKFGAEALQAAGARCLARSAGRQA
ncbi:hypothetical protein ACLBWX_08425 [Methylobacterium sp. M6A4_1b]